MLAFVKWAAAEMTRISNDNGQSETIGRVPPHACVDPHATRPPSPNIHWLPAHEHRVGSWIRCTRRPLAFRPNTILEGGRGRPGCGRVRQCKANPAGNIAPGQLLVFAFRLGLGTVPGDFPLGDAVEYGRRKKVSATALLDKPRVPRKLDAKTLVVRGIHRVSVCCCSKRRAVKPMAAASRQACTVATRRLLIMLSECATSTKSWMWACA